MYDPFSPRVKGKPLASLLSERDEKVHLALRRPVASAYTLSTLLDYEPLVDTMIEKLLNYLSPYATEGKVCDLNSWLRWCMYPSKAIRA